MYLPDPGVKPGSPALQADSLPAGLPGNPSGNGYPLHHSFLAGESHGQRRLAGCSPWGCKELDKTDQQELDKISLSLEKELNKMFTNYKKVVIN